MTSINKNPRYFASGSSFNTINTKVTLRQEKISDPPKQVYPRHIPNNQDFEYNYKVVVAKKNNNTMNENITNKLVNPPIDSYEYNINHPMTEFNSHYNLLKQRFDGEKKEFDTDQFIDYYSGIAHKPQELYRRTNREVSEGKYTDENIIENNKNESKHLFENFAKDGNIDVLRNLRDQKQKEFKKLLEFKQIVNEVTSKDNLKDKSATEFNDSYDDYEYNSITNKPHISRNVNEEFNSMKNYITIPKNSDSNELSGQLTNKFSFNPENMIQNKEKVNQRDYISIKDHLNPSSLVNLIDSSETIRTTEFKNKYQDNLYNPYNFKVRVQHEDADKNIKSNETLQHFGRNKQEDKLSFRNVPSIDYHVIRNTDMFLEKLKEVSLYFLMKGYFKKFKDKLNEEDMYLNLKVLHFKKVYNFSLMKRTILRSSLIKAKKITNNQTSSIFKCMYSKRKILDLLLNFKKIIDEELNKNKLKIKMLILHNQKSAFIENLKANADLSRIVAYRNDKYKAKALFALRKLLHEKRLLLQRSYLLNKIYNIRFGFKRLKLVPLNNKNRKNTNLLCHEYHKQNLVKKAFLSINKIYRESLNMKKCNMFTKKNMERSKQIALTGVKNAIEKPNIRYEVSNEENDFLLVTVEKRTTLYETKNGFKTVVRNEIKLK